MPNKRYEGFFPCHLMCHVPVCPEKAGEVLVPLTTKLVCMFSHHDLKGTLESLYHAITLGVVGGGIQFLDPQECADI